MFRLKLILISLPFIVISDQLSKSALAIIFDEVSTLHVWITISSLANRDPTNSKALLFRQIELNWINAPLDDENDYIGLYLDSQPDDTALPVSVHRLDGRASGQIITDFYLPQIDFYNETNEQVKLLAPNNIDSLGSLIGRDQFKSGWNNQQNSLSLANTDRHHQLARRARLPPAAELNDECLGYCLAYHSRNKILARNCLRTNPNWMRNLFQFIGTRSLPSLMLPGTHNSGTYQKQLDKSALHMINKYQMNQDESIFNQLVFGIRHLDLRVGYSKVKQRPERLWIYHDIFRTEVSVNEVLEQVRRFLDLTTHEIIVMDFHRFTVGFQNENTSTQLERHAKLIDLIFKQLANYIVPSYLGQHAPINEYVALGKRLIIGYANKATILGAQSAAADSQQRPMIQPFDDGRQHPVRDIDAAKQDQEDFMAPLMMMSLKNAAAAAAAESENSDQEESDRRVGTRLFNKLKTLKLISNSFSKRSIDTASSSSPSMRISAGPEEGSSLMGLQDDLGSVSRAALFFSSIRHLWPNKDSIDGLAQYMNETTCRKYFGELRSMMAELTPTVFGAISDKYDGNRKLAQQVNRPVSDWIRDRWLHCINIVATDFFLGNDLIRLSIYANKMRVVHSNPDLNLGQVQCRSFRPIEHLLDKSKIPVQFAYQHQPQQSQSTSSLGQSQQPAAVQNDGQTVSTAFRRTKDSDIITHISSDGNKILLKPLTQTQYMSRERRNSFVENVSDGFTNFVSSFKRLLNL